MPPVMTRRTPTLRWQLGRETFRRPASIGWVLIGPRRPMWGRGHACDSGPFASAAAILIDSIAVVSQGTLTPLLRRKTLIGSGSEECPTCAPNQRRSIQPPVAVTGRVTSEPGCSRETQLTRRTKESHADYNACPLWRADSDRRGRADDHHPTRNPLHHAGRDRTPQGVRPHPHPRGQQRRVDPGLRAPRDRPGGPIRPRGAQRRCVRSSRLRSGGDRDDVHDRGTGGTRPLRCRAWRRSHPTSSTRSSGAG
jgi:hypothetical protein